MGSAFWDAIEADVELPATIVQDVDENVKTVLGNVDKQATQVESVVQDFGRNALKGLDNARGDVLYTFRDTKDQALVFADSALDNFALVIDRQTSNFMDLMQMGVLLGLGTVTVFLVLYGDKVFANGIRVGRLNLI